MIRNFFQPDFTESFPVKPLDLLQLIGVELFGGSDSEHAATITAGL